MSLIKSLSDVIRCWSCQRKVRNWDYDYCPYCHATWGRIV